MDLKSKDFLIRDWKEDDRDIIIKIENSMPWMGIFAGEFEYLKEKYQKTIVDEIFKDEYYWIIERKTGEPLGSLSLDIDSETEAHIYIHTIENADMTGFGIQMLDKVLHYISQKYGIENFYAGLWNEDDPSIPIFEEAGYEAADGCIEICV